MSQTSMPRCSTIMPFRLTSEPPVSDEGCPFGHVRMITWS